MISLKRNGKGELVEAKGLRTRSSTIYKPKSKYQKLLNSATFGNIAHETTPGTIIKRKIYENNYFIENVRTADDFEWREGNRHKIEPVKWPK